MVECLVILRSVFVSCLILWVRFSLLFWCCAILYILYMDIVYEQCLVVVRPDVLNFVAEFLRLATLTICAYTSCVWKNFTYPKSVENFIAFKPVFIGGIMMENFWCVVLEVYDMISILKFVLIDLQNCKNHFLLSRFMTQFIWHVVCLLDITGAGTAGLRSCICVQKFDLWYNSADA